MICNTCNLPFDESDLSMVAFHEHSGLKIAEIKGKKVISHAKDIFPNASIQFCMGVHNFLSLNYDIGNLYLESQDFKAGYYQAMEMDLNETYILKS